MKKMKRFVLWASLVGFAIVVVVSMSPDKFAFWAGRVGDFVLTLFGLALIVAFALFVGGGVLEGALSAWSVWSGWKTKIKVSGLDQSAATGRKFRRITVLGPEGMVIVRVSVYETGRIVVARPGGSPTGIGEKIMISPTFQVKRSIWHGDENSGEWDTFELVEGGRTSMLPEDEN